MDPTLSDVSGHADVVAVLVRVVALLDRACREGLHATTSNRSYSVACLTADAQSLCYAAVELLPGGLFPDIDLPPGHWDTTAGIDQRSPPAGGDPARRAVPTRDGAAGRADRRHGR